MGRTVVGMWLSRSSSFDFCTLQQKACKSSNTAEKKKKKKVRQAHASIKSCQSDSARQDVALVYHLPQTSGRIAAARRWLRTLDRRRTPSSLPLHLPTSKAPTTKLNSDAASCHRAYRSRCLLRTVRNGPSGDAADCAPRGSAMGLVDRRELPSSRFWDY